MLVFKFGGASNRNAEAVRNLAAIMRKYSENIVVVVSAMGKTTNALEQIVEFYFSNDEKRLQKAFENLKAFHYYIMQGIFTEDEHETWAKVKDLFTEMGERLKKSPSMNFDYDYDQIVSYGELVSSTIVAEYLKKEGIKTEWKDIRRSIKTDDRYREGRVNWELTGELLKNNFQFDDNQVLLTQGFLGSTINNITTTLGREGSDYTAAIIAYVLNMKEVTIWKDVPGVLNADPKWFDETELLDHLSFQDAIELAYYGASVIHPKTIQPLKKKDIKLKVKSFLNPDAEGTLIGVKDYEKLIPSFIFKMDQVLISISPLDFSFITEDSLEVILGAFAKAGLRINLMQNSAISFQVVVNRDSIRIERLEKDLGEKFNVETENHLELVTIRYYDEETIKRVTVNKEIILEQHNKNVAQMLMRDLGEA